MFNIYQIFLEFLTLGASIDAFCCITNSPRSAHINHHHIRCCLGVVHYWGTQRTPNKKSPQSIDNDTMHTYVYYKQIEPVNTAHLGNAIYTFRPDRFTIQATGITTLSTSECKERERESTFNYTCNLHYIFKEPGAALTQSMFSFYFYIY